MARNGSGTYTQPSNTDAVSGQTASSTAYNTLIDDLETELTDSLSRSGKGAILADISWGGYKVTNLGTPTASTDAATKAYADSPKTAMPTAKVTGDSPYALVAGDNGLLIPVDASSGAVEIDLLAVATAGDGFRFGVIALDITNTITIDPSGSETLNGSATSMTIDRQYDVYWFKCDGTQWFIDGAHEPANEGRLDTLEARSEAIIIAASDETSDLETGTAKLTFQMPYAFTLTEVRATLTTAATGATFECDVNDGGTTIFSTPLTIDVSETTSTSAISQHVLSDTALADGAIITVDIVTVGSSVAGTGLKIYLIGNQT